MAALAKRVLASKKRSLRAYARKEAKAMTPIVQRVLAKHGKAGKKVFVVVDGTSARWVQVTQRGSVKESATRAYSALKKGSRSKGK